MHLLQTWRLVRVCGGRSAARQKFNSLAALRPLPQTRPIGHDIQFVARMTHSSQGCVGVCMFACDAFVTNMAIGTCLRRPKRSEAEVQQPRCASASAANTSNWE